MESKKNLILSAVQEEPLPCMCMGIRSVTTGSGIKEGISLVIAYAEKDKSNLLNSDNSGE